MSGEEICATVRRLAAVVVDLDLFNVLRRPEDGNDIESQARPNDTPQDILTAVAALKVGWGPR